MIQIFHNDTESATHTEYIQLLDLLENELLAPEAILESIEDNDCSIFNMLTTWDILEYTISEEDAINFVTKNMLIRLEVDAPMEIRGILASSVYQVARQLKKALAKKCSHSECVNCLIQNSCPFCEGI